METTIKPQKDSTIRVTTVIAEDERKQAEAKALNALASRVRIKGFRPGKAPPTMVKDRIEDSAILEETVRVLLPQIIKASLEQSKAKPILKPHVSIESASPLTVVCLFTEQPKVSLRKPGKIAVEKKTIPEPSAQEVEKFIRKLLEQDRTDTPVDRAAKEGDAVKAAFVSKDMKGSPVPELTVGNYVLMPGHEDLLAELAAEVIGMKKGEKKTAKVAFKADHAVPAIRGKSLNIEIEVKEVAEARFPELTAEYLKERLKTEKTPEDFRKDIAMMLRNQRQREEMKRREEELYKFVRAAVQMEIPKTLLDAETEGMVLDFEERLKAQQTTIGQWLRQTKKEPEKFMEELKSMATDRITLRFGMQALAEHKEIKPTDDEVKKRIEETAKESHHDLAHAHDHDHEHGEEEPGGSLFENVRWELTMQRLVEQMIAEKAET